MILQHSPCCPHTYSTVITVKDIRLAAFRKLAPELPATGSRELFCHLVFQAARGKGYDVDLSLQYALEYNELLDRPLPEHEVIQGVRTEKVYRYRDETIREMLHLPEEFCRDRGIFCGMSREEKNRRYYDKVRSKKERSGKTKAAQIAARRKDVAIYLELGFTQKKIAEEMHISIRTVKNDYAAIKAMDEESKAEVAPMV